MKNPGEVNLLTVDQVKSQGWIAEARDTDGHLTATQAYIDAMNLNNNLLSLGEFIDEYGLDNTVTVFRDRLVEKLKTEL